MHFSFTSGISLKEHATQVIRETASVLSTSLSLALRHGAAEVTLAPVEAELFTIFR